jgi:1-acyl-sn-glycerol-3-phosphate acyltransferase
MIASLIRYFGSILVRWYYGKITITGAHHVPQTGPLLILANHPNSLIDPILIGIAAKRPVHFLAKATLFDLPLFGSLLRAVGGIPVFRRQDDPTKVEQNAGALDAAVQKLVHGACIGIFPEGLSHDAETLAPLKSGAARIALQASQQMAQPLTILPIGLCYEQKERFKSEILLRIAPPLPELLLTPQAPHDNEVPQHQVQMLREQMASALQVNTIHIERTEWSELLPDIECILQPPADRTAGWTLARRVLIAQLFNFYSKKSDPRAETLAHDLKDFKQVLQARGITLRSDLLALRGKALFYQQIYDALILCLLCLPALVGSLLNLLPWFITQKIVFTLSGGERVMFAVYRIAIGLLTYGSWYLLLWWWLSTYFIPLFAALVVTSLPFLGIFTLWYARHAVGPLRFLYRETVLVLFDKHTLEELRNRAATLAATLLALHQEARTADIAVTSLSAEHSRFSSMRRQVQLSLRVGATLSLAAVVILLCAALFRDNRLPEIVIEGPSYAHIESSKLEKELSEDARMVDRFIVELYELEQRALNLKKQYQRDERSLYSQQDDDAIHHLMLSYLSLRSGLLSILWKYQRHHEIADTSYRTRAFMLSVGSAASLYYISARLVEEFIDAPESVRKLNLGEPQWNIPANLFSTTYENISDERNRKQLARAFEAYRKLHPSLRQQPLLTNVVANATKIFDRIEQRYAKGSTWWTLTDALKIGDRARYQVQALLSTWVGDTRIREPRKGAALFTSEQLRSLQSKLEPGDIILERKNWYLSRAFMPGYWAHAALYLGSKKELSQLGIQPPTSSAHQESDNLIIEAIPQGVRLATTIEVLREADSVAVLRPRLSRDRKKEALARSLTFLGKAYDFEFDFFSSDTIVCTELVYRAYDQMLALPLVRIFGRLTLPPTEIIKNFDSSMSRGDSALDFVAFYDGDESLGHAIERDEAALRQSWERSSLTWFSGYEEAR